MSYMKKIKKYSFFIVILTCALFASIDLKAVKKQKNIKSDYPDLNQLIVIEKQFDKSNKKFNLILNGNKISTRATIEGVIKKYLEYPVNEVVINRILIALYNTDLYSDVKINFNSSTNTFTINIDENRLVDSLTFHGFKLVKDPNLQKKIETRKDFMLNLYKLEETIKELQEYCINAGYLNAEIKKEIRDLANGKIDVTVRLTKHKKLQIENIEFIGNTAFNKKTLLDETFFKERSLLKFFSPKTSYNPAIEDQNRELLKNFYYNNGYIDFRFLGTKVDYDYNNRKSYIKFEIEEGNQYRVNNTQIIASTKIPDGIKDAVKNFRSNIYNQKKVDSIKALIKKYLDKNNYYSDITIQQIKVSNNKIDIVYCVKEVKSNYIDKIVITGNTRTKDYVIRNQLTLHEGDIFDISQIQTSYRRIYNLGFFENVSLDYRKDNDGKITVVIDVLEKKTGEINFGAGYSSFSGIFGKIYYRQSNFLGSGDVVDFGVQKSLHNTGIQGSFYKNNIFGSLLGGGFGAFYNADENEYLDYKIREFGARINTVVPLYEDLNLGLQYLIKNSDVYGVKDTASDYINERKGKTTSSVITYKLSLDKRNLINNTTDGYYLLLSQSVAGIGGDKKFVSTELLTYFYKTLFYWNDSYDDRDAIVFAIKNNAGYIAGYGNYSLRIDDRFFITDIRGFETIDGISPRDTKGKAIGGDMYWVGNAQVEVPIRFIKDLELSGHFFVDYGTLKSIQDVTINNVSVIDANTNLNKIRLSTGIGFTLNTSIAPLTIDLSMPLIYDSKDVLNKISFSMSKRF
jgi:outer membrane protein insertion porin family